MSDATNGHPIDRLSAYLDDELPVADRAQLDRHLAACGGCREHLEALRVLSRAIAGEPVPGVPGDLAERVGRRIDALTVVPFRTRRFVVPATIAATIAGVGFLLIVTYKQGGPTAPILPHPPVPEASDRPASSGDGARPPAPSAAPAETTPPPPATGRATQEVLAKASSELPFDGERHADAGSITSAFDASAEGGVPGGVVGGVVGGIERGAGDVVERKDELRARAPMALDKSESEAGASASAHPVASPRDEASAFPAPCGDEWLDSGVEATWETADRAAALVGLERLARAHGGRLEPPGAGAPGLAFVIVPRSRFAAFAAAAVDSGMRGLDGAVPPGGAACIRQRVTLRPALAR